MEKNVIIGFFGFSTNQLDGQTVKTRSLLKLLENNAISCDYFDMQQLKVKKIFRLLKLIAYADNILYLPAQKNLKYLFPLFYFFSVLFNFNIHYFIVGGWLVEFLKNKPIHRLLLKNIKGIYSETLFMKEELENLYGMNNIDVFPNFRFQENRRIQRTKKFSKNLKLVFMSRITREKGLKIIDDLCCYLKEKGKYDITIAFYGPINKYDSDYFQSLLYKYSFISYNGILSPENIVTKLSQYDVLVLPTRYYTEGLPGAIVEAYMAGLPVVVTDWKHSREFVKDNVTGMIVPFNNPTPLFISSIIDLYLDRNKLYTMNENAIEESYIYSDMNALLKMKKILK